MDQGYVRKYLNDIQFDESDYQAQEIDSFDYHQESDEEYQSIDSSSPPLAKRLIRSGVIEEVPEPESTESSKSANDQFEICKSFTTTPLRVSSTKP